MEALQSMAIVWPSAGRALELLRGSKVNLEEGDLTRLSNHPDRNKRSAEQSMDTEDAFERGHLSNGTADYLNLRPPNFGSTNYGNGQESYPQGIDLQPSVPSNSVVPYFSQFDRWPSENPNSMSFPGTLSTSVLPQLYSTGLVDERSPSVNNRVQAQSDEHGHSHTQRYPQFWADYSTFPQLGTAYSSVSGLPDQVPAHSQPTAPQIHPSAMYLHDQYNIYRKSLPSSATSQNNHSCLR